MSALSPLDRARVARSVAALRGAGWPSGRALLLTAGALPAGETRSSLEAIASSLERGATVDAGSDPLLRLLARGDATGAEALESAARACESEELARRRGWGALVYPLSLIVLAGVVISLTQWVMPRFAGMYQDFGSALPRPTVWVLDSGPLLRLGGTALAVLAAGAMLAWPKIAGRMPGARALNAAAALHLWSAATRSGITAGVEPQLDRRERAVLARWTETTDAAGAAEALARVMEGVATGEVIFALRILPVLLVGIAVAIVGGVLICLYLPIFAIANTL